MGVVYILPNLSSWYCNVYDIIALHIFFNVYQRCQNDMPVASVAFNTDKNKQSLESSYGNMK